MRGRVGRGLVAGGLLLALGCARAAEPGMTIPRPLRRFDVVVIAHDSVDRAVAEAFARRGFKVRDGFRGGTHPAVAYARGGLGGLMRAGAGLRAWLVDTRKGTELAEVRIPADSLPAGAASRGEFIVKQLLIAADAGDER